MVAKGAVEVCLATRRGYVFKTIVCTDNSHCANMQYFPVAKEF